MPEDNLFHLLRAAVHTWADSNPTTWGYGELPITGFCINKDRVEITVLGYSIEVTGCIANRIKEEVLDG